MNVHFNAFEYTSQGVFQCAEYAYDGEEDSGWKILRNNEAYLALGPGYQLLKTRLCGICSTDIDRKFMPFPLPQIIGHEVVTQGLHGGQRYVVEINDSPYYRRQSNDLFGEAGLPTHTPGRMVLGIDRLPGGFGPYILAPRHAIIPIDDLDDCLAVLTEPFAAALQAVIASPPAKHSTVAVLGPRRLGALLIAALRAYRDIYGLHYTIYALSRHANILAVNLQLGADHGINLNQEAIPGPAPFDIVYDTTGTVAGFELALELARHELHLKSTNGQPMCGLNNLTAFVVDELALLEGTKEQLTFTWPNEDRQNQNVYFSPGVETMEIGNRSVFQGNVHAAQAFLAGPEFNMRIPRFDLAVASTLGEIDGIIRPSSDHENALVRPRGAILFKGETDDNPLLKFLARGGRLRSSRCGDFNVALSVFREQRILAMDLAHYLISHCFPIRELSNAFSCAQTPEAWKVVVKHN